MNGYEFCRPSSQRSFHAYGAGRVLRRGDRMFARVSVGSRVAFEVSTDRVSSMGELMGELRSMASRYSGLARVYVRNMSRGWSIERPLMLYASCMADFMEPSCCDAYLGSVTVRDRAGRRGRLAF